MTATNRLQMTYILDPDPSAALSTPRMRIARITGESLQFRADYTQSEEIRSDRMNADPIKVGETNSGGVNLEWIYPKEGSFLGDVISSALFASWTKTPERDNDGTSDSVITDVAETGGVFTVTTGAAFVAGQLIRTTGFTNAGNNSLFVLTTGSATVPAVGDSLLTDEAAPPAAARIKVIGFQGASGDITATSTGLGSTSLNFTLMGLNVGQWVKIGGTGSAFRFGTEALNGWARVTAIAATALTLDNLPTGWTTDAGSAKTIRVFFGDVIKNGTTKVDLAIERGFLGQDTPTYILQRGMVANRLTGSLTSGEKMTGSVEFMGLSGSQSTSSQDGTPDAAPTGLILAANANVGRLAENGSALANKNYARGLTFEINNNLREIRSLDEVAPVDIADGSCDVMVNLSTYFGSNSLYAKVLAGTATNLNARVEKDSQALILGFPRLTPMEGNPNAGGKNQDVMLDIRLQASYDSTTGAHIIMDRLEYYQD